MDEKEMFGFNTLEDFVAMTLDANAEAGAKTKAEQERRSLPPMSERDPPRRNRPMFGKPT